MRPLARTQAGYTLIKGGHKLWMGACRLKQLVSVLYFNAIKVHGKDEAINKNSSATEGWIANTRSGEIGKQREVGGYELNGNKCFYLRCSFYT